MNQEISPHDLERLSAYVDGELSEVERLALQQQLTARPELRSALADLQSLRGLIQRLPRHRLAPQFVDGVMQAAERKMLIGEDMPLAAPAQQVGTGPFVQRQASMGWRWIAVATAAVVMTLIMIPYALIYWRTDRQFARHDALDKSAGQTARELIEPPLETAAGTALSDSLEPPQAPVPGGATRFEPPATSLPVDPPTERLALAKQANELGREFLIEVQLPVQSRALLQQSAESRLEQRMNRMEAAQDGRSLREETEVKSREADANADSLDTSADSRALDSKKLGEMPEQLLLVEAAPEEIADLLAELELLGAGLVEHDVVPADVPRIGEGELKDLRLGLDRHEDFATGRRRQAGVPSQKAGAEDVESRVHTDVEALLDSYNISNRVVSAADAPVVRMQGQAGRGGDMPPQRQLSQQWLADAVDQAHSRNVRGRALNRQQSSREGIVDAVQSPEVTNKYAFGSDIRHDATNEEVTDADLASRDRQQMRLFLWVRAAPE